MTLGERIYQLRTAQNLSQGDLAEKLDVSRQSVSKWETNSAVPELDKLLKMSDLFGVSLDELVRGEGPVRPAQPQQTVTVVTREPMPGRKIAGLILLCMGLLVVLLCTLLGGVEGILIGTIYGSPFLLCAFNCFVFRKYLGLYCGWAVYTAVDSYLRYATGLNWLVIFRTPFWTAEMNYMRLIIGWVQFLVMSLLVVLTVFLKRKEPLELTRKKKRLFLGGIVVWFLWWVLWQICYQPMTSVWWIWSKVFDLLRTVLLTTALSWWVRRRRQNGKKTAVS